MTTHTSTAVAPTARESWARTAFAVLLLAAFVLLGIESPTYSAPDREWVEWAVDTESANRIAMLLVMFAGVAFLLSGATIAGVVGMVGIVIAVVLVGVAGMRGAESDPTIVRALYDAASPGFLLASAGFGVHLATAGLEGWRRVVALVGAAAFGLTLLTILGGDESPLGVFYPLGYLCLVISSVRFNGIAAPSPAQPRPSTR